jgi:hypothetical protein
MIPNTPLIPEGAIGLPENAFLAQSSGLIINQLPYLTNNWRALLVDSQVNYSKYIKIQDDIATLIHDKALLRCRIMGIPGGFYAFNDDGTISPVPLMTSVYQGNYFCRFPDPESVRPNFPILLHTPPISRDEVRLMVDFLNHIRTPGGTETSYVLFEDDALIDQVNGHNWLKLSFQVPVKPDYGYFQTNILRLVLIDMLRYESIFIGIDHSAVAQQDTPLVLGVDWTSCGLIKPWRR